MANIQISELLIRDIVSGRLIDGERLPPERVLASTLNVTVTTLRKSLKVIAKKGMIKQIQGSGNYVCHGVKDDSVYAMFRLELLDGGGLPSAKFIEIKQLLKPSNNLVTICTSDRKSDGKIYPKHIKVIDVFEKNGWFLKKTNIWVKSYKFYYFYKIYQKIIKYHL